MVATTASPACRCLVLAGRMQAAEDAGTACCRISCRNRCRCRARNTLAAAGYRRGQRRYAAGAASRENFQAFASSCRSSSCSSAGSACKAARLDIGNHVALRLLAAAIASRSSASRFRSTLPGRRLAGVARQPQQRVDQARHAQTGLRACAADRCAAASSRSPYSSASSAVAADRAQRSGQSCAIEMAERPNSRLPVPARQWGADALFQPVLGWRISSRRNCSVMSRITTRCSGFRCRRR